MRLLPVIERELRASARQPFTYWLRVLGVAWLGLGIGVGWTLLRGMRGMVTSAGVDQRSLGVMLFGAMNLAMVLALGLLTPLLTADSVSRERREGTLGLLRLTPLRPLDIVLGKSIAQVLKGLTLYLTMLPWLTLPVLLGGVGMAHFALAAELNAGVLVLGLSAGMLASALCRDSAKAILLAEGLSVLLLAVFLLGHQAIFRMQVVPALAGPGGPGFGFSLNDFMPGWYHERGILSRAVSLLFFTTSSGVNRGWNTGLTNVWSDVWAALPARSEHVWHQAAATLLLGCLVASFLILWIAARSVRSAWVEQPPSVAMERMRRKLLTPRYLTDLLQRRLRQTLESNPIGWLHQRSPNARMVKWGWVLAMILGEFLVLSESGGAGESRDLRNAQYLLALALLVGVAFSSAASFRHERENGAFELLLVTPLSVPALIWGRLAGIWRQFLPAAALLAIIQLLLRIWTFAMGRGHEPEVFFAGCFAVVPIVGLWLSMQRRGLLSAGLLTLLTGVVLPLLLVNTLSAFKLLGVNAANAGSTWLVFQGALGLFAFLHLDRALSERRFLSKQP